MPTLWVIPDSGKRLGDGIWEAIRPDFNGQQLKPGQVALPPLSRKEKESLVAEFHRMVTSCTLSFANNPGWKYTWLSSRDRHSSHVLGELEQLWRLRKLLKQHAGDLAFACPSKGFANAVAQMARNEGWWVRKSPMGLVSKLKRFTIDLIVPYFRLAKEMARWFGDILLFKRHDARCHIYTGHNVILVSILDNGVLSLKGKPYYSDTYFGELASTLITKGERCLLFGFIMGKSREIAGALPDLAIPAGSMAGMLRVADLPVLALRSLKAWIPLWRNRLPLPEREWYSLLVCSEMYASLGSIFACMIVETAMARLLALNPEARVITVFENHPWNIAVLQAAKNAEKPRHCIGFMHCAVLPSHMKNRVDEVELSFRPQPDRIVCIGAEARDIYVKYGKRNSATVSAGCDLRASKLLAKPPRECPPKQINALLVLLQGLPEMVKLIRFLDAAPIKTVRSIYLRGHPRQMPLNELSRLSGVPIGENEKLKPSLHKYLEDDLAEADAIVYKASTAVFEGIYQGIPAIHFDDDWLLPDDPLFRCSALKWEVRKPEDLEDACRLIEGMSQTEFQRDLSEVRSYLRNYLGECNNNSITSFLEG